MSLPQSVKNFIDKRKLKPVPTSHLPKEIFLQRFLVPDLSGMYWVEEDKLLALNMSGMKFKAEEVEFLKEPEFSTLCALNLSNNHFQELTVPENLTDLQYLDLRGNERLESITFQKGLPLLERLFLSGCKLKRLELKEGFEKLFYVECMNNESLEDVSFLAPLPELTHLYLSNGRIKKIHHEFELSELRYLLANNNQLTDFISKNTHKYPVLVNLDLSNNQINIIPNNFNKLFPLLQNLFIKDNPLSDAILSNLDDSPTEDLAFIRRYTKRLEIRATENNEYKILILGNGYVGKTTLLIKLVEKRFEELYKTTHGIVIKERYVGNEETKSLVNPFTYHFWDFAGQDIYHATHRLFMQRNSIYLILWDRETEEKPHTIIEEAGKERKYENFRLPYWLHFAQLQGKGSPVLVVQTKRDEHGVADVSYIRNAYDQKFVVGFIQIESSKGNIYENGYYDLLAAMRKAVKWIKDDTQEIPALYDDVRQKVRALKEEGKKWLTMSEFETVCIGVEKSLEKNEFSDILNWLTQSGVLFYQEDTFEGIILDQLWAIKAIYILFDREEMYYELLQAKQGKFTGQYLEDRRVWNKYDQFEKELFISFMLSCEMIFETTTVLVEKVPFAQRSFIAPQLLPERNPNVADHFWDDRPALYMEYEHKFFHYGIIQSFIVRTHPFAQALGDERPIWKMGTRLLEIGENRKKIWAQVEAKGNLIQVKVTANGKRLLDKIRNEIDTLSEEDGKTWVSVDGEYFVLLKELEELIKDPLNKTIKAINRKKSQSKAEKYLDISSLKAFLDLDKNEAFPDIQELDPIDQRRLAQIPIIKKMISRGELEKAIDSLLEYAPESLEDQTFGLLAKFNLFEQKRMRGRLTKDEINVRQNEFIDESLSMCNLMLDTINQTGVGFGMSERGMGKHRQVYHEKKNEQEEQIPSAKVYFSYAWGDTYEAGESRETLVDRFYNGLIDEPFELKRDNKDIPYGGMISEFMEELGKGDLIVVFFQ